MAVKEIIASVAISILILAPTTFFVLPLLYPDMKDGGTIQFVYEEFDSLAFCPDSVDDYELINQTTLTISTQGKSLLSIRFVMQAILAMGNTMVGALQFEIALTVSGVGNRTLKVAYYQHFSTGVYHEIPADVTIDFATDVLAQGTYIIGVYWKSTYDTTGINYMIAYNPPNFLNTRSLQVEEIRV